MIQSNELRIGNKVLFHGEVDTICEIGQANNGFCENSGYFNFDKGAVKPIPLSEEVLLKCGFSKCTNSSSRFSYRDGSWVFNDFWLNEDFEPCIENYRSDSMDAFGEKIEYLHQLQNLYHSTKRKELEVNL